MPNSAQNDQNRLQNTPKHLLLAGFTALPGLEGVSGPRTGRNVERHPISVFGCRFPIAGPTVTRGIRPTRSSVAFKATLDLTPRLNTNPGLQLLGARESYTICLVGSKPRRLPGVDQRVQICAYLFQSVQKSILKIFLLTHTVRRSRYHRPGIVLSRGGCDLAALSVVCDRWWVIFSGEGGKSFYYT